jgi:hypothetical protein
VSSVFAAVGWWGLAQAAPKQTSPGEFNPISPCRLVDTRPSGQVGDRNTKIGPAETITISAFGPNGECDLPIGAVGIVANVTAIGPTASSFLTLFPADLAAAPNASSLNYAPGGAPTPNEVSIKLSPGGQFKAFNAFGGVDPAIDIVGYYTAAGAATPHGIVGHEVVILPGILEVGQREGSFQAKCPDGMKVLGGGYSTFNADIKVTASTPLDSGTTWLVSTTTFSGANIAARSSVNVRIVCAPTAEVTP